MPKHTHPVLPGLEPAETAPPTSRAHTRKRAVPASTPSTPVASDSSEGREILEIPIERIIPGRYQVRHYFDSAGMRALEESIQLHGLLQPVVVRRAPEVDGRFELIAGERRVRACRALGHGSIQGILVADASEDEVEAMALAENEDRSNLSKYEVCLAALQILERRRSRGADTRLEAVGKLFRIGKAEVSRRLSVARSVDGECIERAGLGIDDLVHLPIDALYLIARIPSLGRRAASLKREVALRTGEGGRPPRKEKKRETKHEERSQSFRWCEYTSGEIEIRLDPDRLTAAEADRVRPRIQTLLRLLREAKRRE